MVAEAEQTMPVDALLSFAAALVSLRLAGRLLSARRFAWGAGLLSFAAAAAAMAWGSAHGWDAPSFRVYYLAGALLSAPLLGVGSLQLAGRRWAAPLGPALRRARRRRRGGDAGARRVRTTDVPRAQDHVDAFPRVLAIAGSSLGALAVVIVAAATLRRRPLRNGFCSSQPSRPQPRRRR